MEKLPRNYFLKKFSQRLCSFSNYLGCAILFLLMFLTIVDFAGRYVFNKPVLGMFELTEFMMVSLVFLGMGYTQRNNGHISVTIFARWVSPAAQFFLRLFNNVLSSMLLLIISVKSFTYSLAIKDAGDVSAILKIPVYPFIMVVSFGALVMIIEIFVSTFDPVELKD